MLISKFVVTSPRKRHRSSFPRVNSKTSAASTAHQSSAPDPGQSSTATGGSEAKPEVSTKSALDSPQGSAKRPGNRGHFGGDSFPNKSSKLGGNSFSEEGLEAPWQIIG